MAIAPGTRLGPYELDSRIGAGGMGEVWRARDTRLDRRVAIKLLSSGFAADAYSKTRFEREARTISQLEHPNICRLYDVGEARDDTDAPVPYLVTELLDGETLRAKLGESANGHGPLSVRKALDYAGQLAEGLAAAHERGIVHRDLKPENIFITRDGRVKVIDFGIAKATAPALAGMTAETAAAGTAPGLVIGTVAYMSPEQIRGADVDHRSDLFSLGVVLFEMISGKRPFDGRSAFETMHAIVTSEPPPLDTVTNPPPGPGLSTIIGRLLEKEPQQRFQSARDLTFAFQALSLASGTSTTTAPLIERRTGSRALAIAAAAVVGLAAGAGLVRVMTPPAPVPPHVSLKRLTFDAGLEQYPTLAPDGKTFLFVSSAAGNQDIYLRRVDGRNAINLTPRSPAADSQPAFSPDGSLIAFRSSRDGGGIFVMGATGESVKRLTTVGYNPSWAPDGSRIAFSTESVVLNPRLRATIARVWTADTASGATRQITKALDAVQPSWSPHGHRIAFWGIRGAQRDVWTIDPDAADPDASAVAVTDDAAIDWNPFWSADGTWLYFASDRGGSFNLWRIAIDERTGVTRGTPEPVTLAAAFPGHMSLARQSNTIIFTGVLVNNAIERLALDAPGDLPVTILNGSLSISAFDVSPDGGRIAFSAASGPHEDLFVMNSDGSQIEQLTDDAPPDRAPVWSSDGTSIYFYSERDGRYEIYSIRPDGGGLTQVTHQSAQGLTLPRPSPDGSRLLVQDTDGALLWDLRAGRTLPLPRPAADHVTSDPRWSPDGRRVVAFENPAEDLDDTLGIVVLDVEAGTYRRVADDPAYAVTWLSNTAIAFAARGALTVLDLSNGTRREIKLRVPPAGARSISASPDGKFVYVRTVRVDGDLWLATLSR
jgi:Tol biopolymer transport system component/serine/threonine protein kinase